MSLQPSAAETAPTDDNGAAVSPPLAEQQQTTSQGHNAPPDHEPDSSIMSFKEHFIELRKRLLRAFGLAFLGFLACYPFAQELFSYLVLPLKNALNALPNPPPFIFNSPYEAFLIYLKTAFIGGIFASSPLIFYQIWAFIAPGLYASEKRYLIPIALFSGIFFCLGAAFCYLVAMPQAFDFLLSYETTDTKALITMQEGFSTSAQLLFAFGLVFELPLAVFILARLGIITAAWMRKTRRYAILVNIILAAILTPPDVVSQLLMAIPLLILYELSILVAVIFGKKKAQAPVETEA